MIQMQGKISGEIREILIQDPLSLILGRCTLEILEEVQELANQIIQYPEQILGLAKLQEITENSQEKKDTANLSIKNDTVYIYIW